MASWVLCAKAGTGGVQATQSNSHLTAFQHVVVNGYLVGCDMVVHRTVHRLETLSHRIKSWLVYLVVGVPSWMICKVRVDNCLHSITPRVSMR